MSFQEDTPNPFSASARRASEEIAPPAPIERLNLPSRVYRSLKAAGIHTVEQVRQTQPGDLLKIRNFGRRSLAALKQRLAGNGWEWEFTKGMSAKTADVTVLMGLPVEQSGFSDDLVGRLHLAQIERLGDLVTKTPKGLARFPSLGPASIQKVRRVLNDLGLDLGMDFIPVDETSTVWMDRLDVARNWARRHLSTPAAAYCFSREYGVSEKMIAHLKRHQPLNAYETARLRQIFSKRIDLSKPFDLRALSVYRNLMEIRAAYTHGGSLKAASKVLGISHEQVRAMLRIGDRFKLISYSSRRSGKRGSG